MRTGSSEQMKAVLKYPGAKNRLANWICEYIPKHMVYLEPFFGSGAVLFNKSRSHIETVNDLHGEVVNYFKILRDEPDALKEYIELTPYSREEYDNSYIENTSDTELERARKFCIRCWQGFGCANLYHNGWKSGQQQNSPNPAAAWSILPETLLMAAKRLNGVQIENLPAVELIRRYDTKDVFIYADPPYLHGTRKNYLYKHEMENAEHVELLEILAGHPGKVLLSGYDNDLYNSYLSGWKKVQKKTQAEAGLPRTETLWMNYKTDQMDIFDFI